MKIYFLLALMFIPAAADAESRFHRQDVGRMERQHEYKCIAEKRDGTYDELRACIREKKGSAFITINKFWEEDPAKRKLQLQ
jgi:hypothetical protein